ncbi:MAG: type II secretion system minor pseudopilin GspI [Hyphomonadaceae bacterium]|nr:type II secretion system minor pseudopilin GspI [Hyphomonadaceae bacterium]
MVRARPDMQGEAGFTLVEVLAALAVFSIAATGLVHIAIENTRTAQIVETRALAGLLADNTMTDLVTAQGRLEQGTQRDEVDMFGRTWLVERDVRTTENPLILRLSVRVHLPDEDASTGEPGPVHARLDAFRRTG